VRFCNPFKEIVMSRLVVCCAIVLLVRALSAEAADDAKANAALKTKLMQKVKDFEKPLENVTLGDIVEFFGETYKIPVKIDTKQFQAIGIQKPEETAIKLPGMPDVTIATALDRITAQIKGDEFIGTYEIRDGAVWIVRKKSK
jgi:hypothetical protein